MPYNTFYPAGYYSTGGNGYGSTGYGGYGYPQPTGQTAQSGQTVYWIQGGEAGAKAFTMGPSQSVLLMDSEADVFYIKTTDASGMPLPLRIFDFAERTAKNAAPAKEQAIDTSVFVTRAEFEERLAAFAPAPAPAAKKPVIKKAESDSI